MAGLHRVALALTLPAVAGGPGAGSGTEAAASVLLLWLCLLGASALLLCWGVPMAAATLVARGREQHPASALLWAGLLGWIGFFVFLHRSAEKQCPHCHARIVAETARCYWCEGDTLPAPLPAWLRS